MDSVGEGEGGKIWENGIETCKISCMQRVASPGSMHDTGCLELVHWDDPEGWYGEGGGFRMGNTCIPKPGIEPRSPELQADSLLTEPPGKPKNSGVGSLSLLQGIFPTQELNQGLLHCRQILYQLSFQGSP